MVSANWFFFFLFSGLKRQTLYGESQQKSKVFTLDKHPEECGEVKVAEEYQGHTPGHLYLKQQQKPNN